MTGSDYEAFLDELIRRTWNGAKPTMRQLFHHIRRIPYGAAGQRDPRQVYEKNVGSCSGKHILLRDLMRRARFEADVITIFTHFNKGVPENESMPSELLHLIRDEDVPDFHHYVRAREPGGAWHKLDATWHDELARFGFPVNDRWDGLGDTQLAAECIEEYSPVEDVATLKQQCLRNLSEIELRKRARFFELLTAWIAELWERKRP